MSSAARMLVTRSAAAVGLLVDYRRQPVGESVMINERSSAVQMLNDLDEGPFLRAIVCAPVDRPADDDVWLGYAEFLEDRNDPRGEFLRLDRGLSARVPLDDFNSPHQARYRKLFHLLRPYATWLKFVTRNDRILNCGRVPMRPWRSVSSTRARTDGKLCQ